MDTEKCSCLTLTPPPPKLNYEFAIYTNLHKLINYVAYIATSYGNYTYTSMDKNLKSFVEMYTEMCKLISLAMGSTVSLVPV